MTKSKEILKYLNDYDIVNAEYLDNIIYSYGDGYILLKKMFGDIEYAYNDVRSSEGDHDSCKTVLFFKDHNLYIGIEGYYSSNEGSEYDEGDWKEFKKETKTITYYEQKI